MAFPWEFLQRGALFDVFGAGSAVGGIAQAAGNVAAAGIGAGAAISAANTQADAAKYAADQSYKAASDANNTQLGEFNKEQANIAPYLSVGTGALGNLAAGVNAGDYTSTFQPSQLGADQVLANDPGYQFRLDQGAQALQRAQAAGGYSMSGQSAKELTQYAQDYASQEYGAASNRFLANQQFQYNVDQGEKSTAFNQSAALAGIGQTAVNQLNSAGQNYANTVSGNTMAASNAANNYYTSGAAAQAAGQVGVANAFGGALSNIGNNLQQQSMLNQILKPQNQNRGGAGNSAAVSLAGMPAAGVNFTLPNLSYDGLDNAGDNAYNNNFAALLN